MPLPAILIFGFASLVHAAGGVLPPVQLATFGIPDTLFLVVLALVVFGPKKLPEISRQVGKLLYEFRKASNDFKFQIEEELRLAEQSERQKELEAEAKKLQPATPVAVSASETVSAEPAVEAVRAPEPATEQTPAPDLVAAETTSEVNKTPTILPPSTGTPVSTRSPYRAAENGNGEAATDVEALDEMRAEADDAVKAAAAEPSYTSPTHHG
jgi:sec-independent protein translocase protein TatB